MILSMSGGASGGMVRVCAGSLVARKKRSCWAVVSDVEDPRGFGVYLEGVRDPGGDVDERAGRRRYGLAVLKVERDISFEDVERLVILRLGVKRRCHPSREQLLGEREPPTGLLGGSFNGHEAPEEPERLSLLGAESIWGWVYVHTILLFPPVWRRRVDCL